MSPNATPSETDPLLLPDSPARTQKPFYRARPLWLVPFAVIAASVRGLTIASRIEVFTQLNCALLHHETYNQPTHDLLNPLSLDEPRQISHTSWDPIGFHFVIPNHNDSVSVIPPVRSCYSDPEVQAGAARTGAIFTTTMGILSAVSTGYWSQSSQRNGRTRVLAVSTAGMLATDLAFIFVSTPSPESPISLRRHVLFIAPVLEGLTGGWFTLAATTSAYVSDCSSPGSRAHLFSRFTGMTFFGFGLGPVLAGFILKHGLGVTLNNLLGFTSAAALVNLVFYIAVACSVFNLLGALWVFPESLSREARESATFAYNGKGKGKGRAPLLPPNGESSPVNDNVPALDNPSVGIIARLLSPLAIFAPMKILDNGRKRTDWSLALLALALLGCMLSAGIYQTKYLYAEHTYGWSPSQLSWYISWLGMTRAFYLLFLLPVLIAVFKPKGEESAAPSKVDSAKKPPLTMPQIVQEMQFDLSVTKWSLGIDILANICVVLSPDPSYRVHSALFVQNNVPNHSQALFVFASSLSSLGSGAGPAISSLALCIVQARSLCNGDVATPRPDIEGSVSLPEIPSQPQSVQPDIESGKLFGALAVLQAVGQMIIGPMLFGFVYSGTVATYPKAIFVLAAGILTASLTCLFLVRPPGTRKPLLVRKKKVKKPVPFRRFSEIEVPRGRSTRSKDLRPIHPLSLNFNASLEPQKASGSSSARKEHA